MIKKHDLHVHTKLSLCSEDPLATLENYIKRAVELGIEVIGITDHMWDSTNIPTDNEWYREQSYERQLAIRENIPQVVNGIRILWGCETEYAMGKVGITAERAKELDYVLVPHSHFHMKGFTIPRGVEDPVEVAQLAISTFKEVVSLGFATGVAHPFDPCLFNQDDKAHRTFFDAISNQEFIQCFNLAKEKNVSVEINMSSFGRGKENPIYEDTYYRMFRIAKEVGCKFHFGTDTHSIQGLDKVQEENFFIQKFNLKDEDICDLVR